MIGQRVSIDDAYAQLERTDAATRAFLAPILDELEHIDLVDGDLIVDQLDQPWGTPLLVTGHLRSRGPVILDEHSPLFVLGEVQASDLYVWMSALYVGGKLTASGLVYLHSGNDYSARIDGDARFGLLYEAGMFTSIGGAAHGEIIRTTNQVRVGDTLIPLTEPRDVRDRFVPAAWDADEDNLGDIPALLRAGAKALR